MVKLIVILCSVILLTGCGELEDVITTQCVDTKLYVIGTGKGRTTQVYDCTGIDVTSEVQKLKDK